MSLRIVKWETWQGPAVKKLRKDRERHGGDSRRRLRLDYIRVATSFEDPSFLTFAEAVGGRSAVGFWMAVLQYVALNDPEGGSLGAVTRARLADQVLSTPWDRVKPAVGAKVWDALVHCGLAKDDPSPGAAAPGAPPPPAPSPLPPAPVPRRSRTVHPSGPAADPPRDTPRDGPIQSLQGVTSETRGATPARRAGIDLDVEENLNPVVDVDVDPPVAGAAPEHVNGGLEGGRPAAAADPPKASPAASCRHCESPDTPGLRRHPDGTARCCDCPRGRQRARVMRRASAEDRAQAERAAAAARARGGHQDWRRRPLAELVAFHQAGPRDFP